MTDATQLSVAKALNIGIMETIRKSLPSDAAPAQFGKAADSKELYARQKNNN
jgi:hypothetical protein